MIEVRDLTKYYGPVQAVNQINFEVAAGEIVGFLGPNGAGKTTKDKLIMKRNNLIVFCQLYIV